MKVDLLKRSQKQYEGRFAAEADGLMGNFRTLVKLPYVGKGTAAINLAQASGRKTENTNLSNSESRTARTDRHLKSCRHARAVSDS